MVFSSLSIASIVAHYSDALVWGDVCGVTLSDGTRLVATALGDGFRIYRAGMGLPLYVPFA
jgi:xanthine/uracil permease